MSRKRCAHKLVGLCLGYVALSTLSACAGHEMCDVPSLRPKYGTLIKGSEPYGRKAASGPAQGTPYIACEARPVPGHVGVMMTTREGVNHNRIDIQAAGLAHGLSTDDCVPAAISACEEAVTRFFERMKMPRPGGVRCAAAEARDCSF